MVNGNPLFRGGWTVRKFQATVINDIWPGCLFFTLVATSLYSFLYAFSYIDSGNLFASLNSGRAGVRIYITQAGRCEWPPDRPRYGSRFGYLVQNVICL